MTIGSICAIFNPMKNRIETIMRLLCTRESFQFETPGVMAWVNDQPKHIRNKKPFILKVTKFGPKVFYEWEPGKNSDDVQ